MKKYLMYCGAASLLLVAGCGSKTEAPKETPAAATAPAAAPIDEANAATITGKVSFTGDKPTMKNISMDATPACARAHTTPQKSQEVIVNDNGTLKNVLIFVKSGLPDRQWPTPPAIK